MAQPEVTPLLHEHRQLGVRPIPLKFIFPHVFHKDKTILLLRLLRLLLGSSLLALRVVFLEVLPSNRSSPTGLTGEFSTTISQVPFNRILRRVQVYDLDFLDHLGFEVNLLFSSYSRVDVHDPCD